MYNNGIKEIKLDDFKKSKTYNIAMHFFESFDFFAYKYNIMEYFIFLKYDFLKSQIFFFLDEYCFVIL